MEVSVALEMKKAHDSFMAGNYSQGWQFFEARHNKEWAKANGWSQTPRDLSSFQSAEQAVNATGILVHAEGGAGDTVQFARFVPLLATAFPEASIVFEVQNPLVDLIKSFPGMENISVIPRTMTDPADATRKIASPAGNVTHAVALLSLPRVLAYNDLNTMPPPSFPTQPSQASGGPLKIGLCWRGDPNNKFDQGRDVPLAMLLPLINERNVVVTSLLDDVTEAEKAAAPNLRLPNPDGSRISFAAMADIIREQDVIISSDTVWPNLAATLGKPVKMFTLKTPNWRWGPSGENTPWYPSMQLVRQAQAGDWQGPVDQVTAWVKKESAAPKGPALSLRRQGFQP